jgi:integrase
MTGLRNQELLALMWDDINLESATVTIRRACIWAPGFKGFKCTKTGDERTLSLDSQTIGLLNKVKAEQEAYIQARTTRGLSYGDRRLVFCNKGGHVPNKYPVRDSFKRILLRIGITRRFRWYGVRHTHATHLLDVEGANPRMIANRMGHSVEMLFRTYGHEMPNQQSDAVSKISSRVKL